MKVEVSTCGSTYDLPPAVFVDVVHGLVTRRPLAT
jgi:hypothetical protein